MRTTVSIWLTACTTAKWRTWLTTALAGCLIAAQPLPATAAEYQAYAVQILKTLPKGAQIRPDLEAYLDGLAGAYRATNGRKRLIPDNLMRVAARAQAADMMLAGQSGHRSRNGDSFDSRFGAYVDNVDLYRARGENAASERHKGPADRAKAQLLFALWLGSSGHRRNLMKRDYEFVSTGVIQRGEELWAVQIFWSRPIEPNPLIQ
jgi:uncharacterized protein YkwD